MLGLDWADATGVSIYAAAWLAYAILSARWNVSHGGVNALMAQARHEWMTRMGARGTRIIDTQITASLQNGSAFFASASMIALGAAAGLLRFADDAARATADLPLAAAASRGLWEVKVVGLMLVLGYAFFKFAWAYRLFNYSAILIGATPEADDPDAAARARAMDRAARMNVVAGAHFAKGQRALFFAVAYLGWFLGPWLLVAATLFVVVVMSKRQFASDARAALED